MTVRQKLEGPIEPATGSCETVVFVHCSASSPKQWAAISGALPPGYAAVSFELIGHGHRAGWPGLGPMTLREEAVQIAKIVRDTGTPVHLVGHSYGGGIAVQFANDHPDMLRSLVLAEPSCFHLLEQSAEHRHLARDIRRLVDAMERQILDGDYFGAVRLFIDFWTGPGTFENMTDEHKQRLAQRSLLIAHHFAALFGAQSTLASLGNIRVPTLILCGTRSPAPSRAITRLLTRTMPDARHRTLKGANHMAPLDRPELVTPHLLAHIEAASAQSG